VGCERRNVEKVVTEQVDKLTTRSRGRGKRKKISQRLVMDTVDELEERFCGKKGGDDGSYILWGFADPLA
jgi:hypothetical protein